jgi:hypothetical protein
MMAPGSGLLCAVASRSMIVLASSLVSSLAAGDRAPDCCAAELEPFVAVADVELREERHHHAPLFGAVGQFACVLGCGCLHYLNGAQGALYGCQCLLLHLVVRQRWRCFGQWHLVNGAQCRWHAHWRWDRREFWGAGRLICAVHRCPSLPR